MSCHVMLGTSTTVSRSALGLDMPRAVLKWSWEVEGRQGGTFAVRRDQAVHGEKRPGLCVHSRSLPNGHLSSALLQAGAPCRGAPPPGAPCQDPWHT